MKTLLLTLVVVTILCLDLGYTLTCLTHESLFFETTETCSDGQNLCYAKWFAVFPGARRPDGGCAATCPDKVPLEIVNCCTTDKCNL
uniref:Muscarinic toxin MTX6 n=1 Tax=Ophiophagus hannah TaxID=8665 RepID=3SIM6_OPHHA|nr:RecName: Full=Muscarinic toxin MTX6; Flags: Precursor [Ophiophagus hannah]ABB83638.1 muscarinic toxin precursor [Ophiophagus hannah]